MPRRIVGGKWPKGRPNPALKLAHVLRRKNGYTLSRALKQAYSAHRGRGRMAGGSFFGDIWSGIKKVAGFVKDNKLISKGLNLASNAYPGLSKYAKGAESIGLGRRRRPRRRVGMGRRRMVGGAQLNGFSYYDQIAVPRR